MAAKSKRRPKGSYTIRRRGKRYQIQTSVQQDGIRKRRCFTGDSQSEVLAMVRDAIATGKGSLIPRSSGTVGELVETYFERHVSVNCAPSTFALRQTLWYGYSNDKDLRSAEQLLGSQSLAKLTTARVERFYDDLRSNGRSESTIRDVAIMLKMAINNRRKAKQYHGENPFELVDLPRSDAKERRALDPKEALRFEASARGDRYEALWILLHYSGLRLGEALGLEWSAIDFDNCSLLVQQSASEVRGVFTLRPPKTKASRRTVPLTAFVISALRAHRKSSDATSNRFVFTTDTGHHPSRSMLRQRHFLPICKRAQISGFVIHGLRHTFASIAIMQGMSLMAVAATLGHASVKMVLERYGHMLAGMDRQAVDAVDAAMAKVRKLQAA
jgi:integrase